MASATRKYMVEPGGKINLSKMNPAETALFEDGKKVALEKNEKMRSKIDSMQEMLYAQKKHRILIVLQGIDTAGKDGTIRHVFEGVNPQGVKVASFKKPTEPESDHDFLWRVHPHVPGKGEIVIFNRSHYEDVLVVRVHDLVPEKIWKKRYDHINNFEKMLSDEGVTILKFFLYIDRDEQKKRLLSRQSDETKQWKLSESDVPERKLWDKYIKAYEEAISRTSTKDAPWYVIPSNHKWYRNYLISRIISETMEDLKLKIPKPSFDVSKLVIE